MYLCFFVGIIHRDLKPENICVRLDSHTTPLIVDVGISSVAGHHGDDTSLGVMFASEPFCAVFTLASIVVFCSSCVQVLDPPSHICFEELKLRVR